MNISKYLEDLRSPATSSVLKLENGKLLDDDHNEFPIVNGIPRFIKEDNYANSFGFQWNVFQKTQLDYFSAKSISSQRFYKNTGWSNEELLGKKILEVGSGAGRFTEVLLKTGASVYSIDYSNAVEANWNNNCNLNDFFLAQASIYELPFKKNSFDYVFCFGVLQHTPDVKAGFLSMVEFLKPGGEIAIDVYAKNWKTILLTKYWVRPITKRISKEKLLNVIKWYVPKWLPVSNYLIRVPGIGKFFAQIVPVCNYSKQFPFLNQVQLTEWAILDTFDMLSPAYDYPQSLSTLRQWASEANLKILYCGKGDNGYVLKAKK